MTLLRAAEITLSWGSRTLFSDLTFVIEEGERVGLVGVNGSGKSTLMKILASVTRPDTGELQLRRGARVEYLPQEPSFPAGATVASELTVAQDALKQARGAHDALATQLAGADAAEHPRLLARLAELSDRVEQLGGWDTAHQARKLLDRLGVPDWERPIDQLSGGLKKRVAIARALLARPDLLLLDEPTNHLDADTVEWLEQELDSLPGALLLVTHDRYFLDDLVERIVEIEPGGTLSSWPGNYEAYVEQKLVRLEEADVKEHKRQRWIAREVAWLRKGVEARRTKSRARIERARALLNERGFQRPKTPALQLGAPPRLGRTVIETDHVSKAWGERAVFRDVSVIFKGGERVGIVGPNGIGKTTFLRVALGELPPDSGTVTIGQNTRIAYYDQHREALDPEKTVYEAACDSGSEALTAVDGGPGRLRRPLGRTNDWVTLGDTKVALRDYLDDLLFPVPMQRMKVAALSGGERNRLLLARLFIQGANVLALDEPTNDLDLVTLNVLEGLLEAFRGTVLLVTHDRYFLDKVATAILAFEPDGGVVRYEGNYAMYRTLKAQVTPAPQAPVTRPAADPAETPAPRSPRRPGKLSYNEQRELEGMEAAIDAAETKKRELEATLNDPAAWAAHGSNELSRMSEELEETGRRIDALYARWQQLQTLAGT